MAQDKHALSLLALHRLGFGPRPATSRGIASDPREAVLAELDGRDARLIVEAGLLSTGEAARATFDYRQERSAARFAERATKELERQARPSPGDAKIEGSTRPGDTSVQSGVGADVMAAARPNPGPGIPQQLYLEEAKARYHAALQADIGFVERLVWFWSNHFCISADKGGPVRAMAGAFEREAIRPHVLGKFANMLLAVESHPAMLLYLDNAGSIGPKSQAGINRGRGLNENLAREILELHTLGVRTVYNQADVTSLANMLTGWSISPLRQDPIHGGEFEFHPRAHEPGAQTLLGQTYAENGFQQGRAALTALAVHPATAKHVARKLAQHFVADQPPPALVDRITKRWLDTQGDLKEVSRALVHAPEVWNPARNKMKRPGEWIVGALRTFGIVPSEIQPLLQAQNLLGEPLWRPPSPKGFPDEESAWIDGLGQRVQVAQQLANRVASLVDPDAALETALGPLVSADTRQVISRAESRPQALALLLMSPEFQRR